MKRFVLLGLFGLVGLSGCGGGTQYSQQPISAAPPAGAPAVSAPGAMPASVPPSQGVYNWQDVPRGQQVPINRAVFDQAGYQIYAASGETIAVPFVNQNLYVMQFGRSHTGQSYFVNEGSVPVLYLRPGDFLENAAAQGARWYPLPDGFQEPRPVYVALAPSWSAYTDMGWYPGMVTYGGLWGYHPYSHFAWMPSFVIQIGGQRYPNYTVYHSYYTSHPGYIRTRRTLNYTVTGSSRTFGRSASGGGSFNSGKRFGGGSTGGGSFNSGRRFGSGGGSFGSSRPASGGSFGSGRPAGSAFGTARPNPDGSVGSAAPPRGSFGSARPSGGFGGSRPSGSSFGSSRPSGSSFGGGSFGGRSSSGSSFGGSRPSGGFSSSSGRSSGSSFGGGRSSGGGGSFGSRRR